MPKVSTLEACFDSNPNGAGYMYRRNNMVHIRKGFMKFKDFYDDAIANVGNKDDVVFHFRIATHGKISPENTHPFPITSVRSELHELIFDCKRALVHNGILYDFVDRNDDISDSAFFAKMLYPCRRESQYKAVLGCHNKSSKFVVMTSKFTTVSGQFVKKYGCYFSNYGFECYSTLENTVGTTAGNTVVLPSGHSYTTPAKWNVYDDEFDKFDNEMWEKVYGDNDLAMEHYRRNKRGSVKSDISRRGATYHERVHGDKEKITFRDYIDGKEVVSTVTKKDSVGTSAWVRAGSGTGIAFGSTDGKSVNLQLKLSDGSTVSADTKPIPQIPDKIRVNGRDVTFSVGMTNEKRLEAVKHMMKYPSESKTIPEVNYYPLLSLLSPDGKVTIMVGNNVDKGVFFDYVNKGYSLQIDNLPIGDKNQIIVLGNARNILGEMKRTVVMTSKYVAKFYNGGIDGRTVISIHTVKDSEDALTVLSPENERISVESFDGCGC